MAGIEERGIFWPRGTEIPTGQLTPDNGIGGLLTIDLGGKIRLELDSIFPRRGGSLVAILSPEQDPSAPTSIEGVLSKGRHHVLLLATRKVGGSFNPAWVSHENYMAIHALLCKHPFPRDGNDLKFSEISSNLIGFEEWIGLGSIEFVEDGEKRTATYERPKNPTYNISGLTLLVEFDLRSPYPSTRLHDVTLTECAYLKMKFDDPLSLDDAIREHLGLQDLLTLLTDTEYTLEWPQLTLSGEDSTCTAYFGRHASSGKPPEMHHCLVLFPWIKEQFGNVVQLWRQKRKALGPGLYLYMGTRRGLTMYVEHRFVNLIWGLESLHRTKFPEKRSTTERARADKILEEMQDAGAKKWLTRKLKYAAELPLDQRLFDLFSQVVIVLEENSLRKFSKACADLRNEVSHFGNIKEMDYKEGLRDLDTKSDAISFLYQVLLLQEIGIARETILSHFFKRFRSSEFQRALRSAGLDWQSNDTEADQV